MITDSRTVRLKQVWAAGSPNVPDLLVDPVRYAALPAALKLGQFGHIVHGRNANPKDVVLAQVGDVVLGYGAQQSLGLPTMPFVVPKDPTINRGGYIPTNGSASSKHLPIETVVVTGATTTHTLVFNRRAGGSLMSWTVENAGAGFNDQVLNRYDSFVRGIQATAEWADAVGGGELTKHQPMQGGDYFSLPTLGDASTSSGSVLNQLVVGPVEVNGARVVDVLSTPLDFDPDGAFAAPGLPTGHDGAKYNPTIWKDVRIGFRLTINWNGIENVHRLETRLFLPWEVKSGFFDVGLYSPVFLDAGKFAQVRCLDAVSGTETTLSDGTLGAGDYFEAHYRTYHMNQSVVFENDVGNVAGGSKIPGGYGGIAGTGAADANLAFAVCGPLSGANLTATDVNASDLKTGTQWVWAQNRADAGGIDGANCVFLAMPALLTGRLHTRAQVRRIASGWSSTACFLITDTWTNVKAKMAQLKALNAS